uniref:Uncharacterized protein n=1 Tax=Alexandrium catenella TaxID=2925 RepID=A0A7S1WQH1_ALECA
MSLPPWIMTGAGWVGTLLRSSKTVAVEARRETPFAFVSTAGMSTFAASAAGRTAAAWATGAATAFDSPTVAVSLATCAEAKLATAKRMRALHLNAISTSRRWRSGFFGAGEVS